MTKNNLGRHFKRGIYRASPILIPLLVLCFGYGIRQRIYDAIKLYNYHPPAAISTLAQQDTMNAYTKKVFYVNHPSLENTVHSFRQECPEDVSNIILGCYHVGEHGIYIYNVHDAALYGIRQVTAAHEVLHALYARLNPDQRRTLDNQLQSFYEHDLTNSRVKQEIAIYQKTEPGSVYDEMSCTFGTEIASLPPGLSSYYSQFFHDRMAIVKYEQTYQAVFTIRKAAVKADDAALQALKDKISTEQSILRSSLQSINDARQNLQNLKQNDPSNYNQAIPAFNSSIESYNLGIGQEQKDITTFNNLVAQRNQIAGSFDTLIAAIDTRVKTQSH